MKHILSSVLVCSLALGVAACGSEPDAADMAAEKESELTAGLSAIQKVNFERMNREDITKQYDEIVSDLSSDEEGTSETPAQDEMEFVWLDRDENGKLSVAEFALWKVPEPSAGLSDEQIDDVGSTFFANDADGDMLLSETEFAAATGRPVPEADEDAAAQEG